jgi:hypothetical protein
LDDRKTALQFYQHLLHSYHYLDDFLFAGADKTSNCSKLMNTFTEVCSKLGVPIAGDKTEGPSTRITNAKKKKTV